MLDKLNNLPLDLLNVVIELKTDEFNYLTTMLISKKDNKSSVCTYQFYKDNIKDFNILDVSNDKELQFNILNKIIDSMNGNLFINTKDILDVSDDLGSTVVREDNLVKICIYNIINDMYIKHLEEYINNNNFKTLEEKIAKFLEENEKQLDLSLLTVLIYLNNNKDRFNNTNIEFILDNYLANIDKYITIGYRGFYKSYQKMNNDYKKLNEKFEKLKNENKELKEENKLLKNLKEQFNKILNDINDNIYKKETAYEKAFKEAKALRFSVMENTYNSIINNLNTQIFDLKTELREVKAKNSELEEKIRKLNQDKEQFNIINNDVDNEKEEEIPKNQIGYCEIEGDKHYVIYFNGEKKELLNLPEHFYLADKQFIFANNDGEFIYAYNFYKNIDIIGGNINIGYIVEENGSLYAISNNKKIKIYYNEEIVLKQGQVIGYDDNGFVKLAFKSIKFSLDNYINSIKAKKHKLYFVLKKLNNGIMARNILEDTEEFIDMLDNDIEVGNILCFNAEGKLVNNIKNSKFYTLSSFYKYQSYATIVTINGEFYCKNQNTGEILKIKSCDKDIKENDVVIIDEFVNVLAIVDSETEYKKIAEQRNKRKNEKEEKQYIDITHRVLIVGNKSYELSYKLNFLKHGYEAEVVDGYSPYAKISTLLKDVDCVIVISNFISHDNMWKLKEENVPILYPASDGANRVLEEFQNYISKTNSSPVD